MSLSTGNNAIDALIYSSWNSAAQTPVTLTYGFLTRAPAGASVEDRNGFLSMSATQQAAVRDALAQWASVANITFIEAAASTSKLQFGTNVQTGSSAYAYLPDTGINAVQMYLNNKEPYNAIFTPGSYGPSVVLHEIGHMLGLKHPGDYDATGSGVDGPFLPAATDNGDYTQMSYNDPTGYAIAHKFQTTAMLYDIQAIQYLYGANMGYHAGNDTYTLAANVAPMCIWDAGGSDVLDFSACTSATVINLNAGAFSETARGLNNVSIAYNVTIESAIAGSGGSVIYANGAGNRLQGGNDTVVFTKSFASYTVVRDGATLTVSGDGTDSLTGVESLRFADRTVSADLFTAIIQQVGTDGDDVIAVSASSTRVDAGAGWDVAVLGGARAAYGVTAGSEGFAVVQASTGIADVLVNVERVQFGDGNALALDVAGSPGQLYRMYETAFNRVPDVAGLGFWLKKMDAGVDLVSIALGFAQSEEYAKWYGQADNEHFVTQLYVNSLDRQSQEFEVQYWAAKLDNGMSRAELLVNFSQSDELQVRLAGVIQNGVDYIPYA
jgi:serralysin